MGLDGCLWIKYCSSLRFWGLIVMDYRLELDTFIGISDSTRWDLSAYTWTNCILKVTASAWKLCQKSGSDGLLAKRMGFTNFH